MAITSVRSKQITDGQVQRVDLDVTNSGTAVIAKAIAGTGISLSQTGPDAGTGDVTITNTGVVSITATEATATADATNAGTVASPNVMTGMTLTPAAGTYLVDFTAYVDHSNQSVAVVVSQFTAGAQNTDTVRSPVPRFNGVGANSLSPVVAISTVAVVDGSQAIDIRWGTASGTATVHQRTLRIVKIA